MTRRRPSQPPVNFWEGNPACWRWKVPTQTEADRLQEKHLRELRRYRPSSEPRPLSEESLRWILMDEMHKDRCAACGCPSRRLLTDHDHETGLIRGFLCPSCNTSEALSPGTEGVFGKYRAIYPALMCGIRREYHSGWGGAVVLPPEPAAQSRRPTLYYMRAWIELPEDYGWGDIRVARGTLHRMDYFTAELRGTGNVMLRLSGVKLEAGEVLRMPGQMM